MGKFKYTINLKKVLFKPLMWILTLALLPCTFSSCQDDLQTTANGSVEEGLPATIKLKVKFEDVDVQTRALYEDEEADFCENLWIGIFSQDTDKRISSIYHGDMTVNSEVAGEEYEVALKTQSANNVYIVAVSNSKINDGVAEPNLYVNDKRVTLREALDDADTFTKFKKLCALRPDPADINVYASTLTMSGWYAPKSPRVTGDKDVSTIPTVNIVSGDNELEGAIYLRRLLAYNKFFVVPGEYITLKLNTWKVCNVPAGCYLLEQDGNEDGNAGDDYTGTDPFYNETKLMRDFTAATNSKGEAGHYFDFYMVENKHKAIAYSKVGDDHVGIDPNISGESNLYNEREREFKTSAADSKVANTGIYKSLVASTDGDLCNNNATYVVLNATIDYYVAAPTDGSEYDATTAEPIDPNSDVAKIHRTADVTYTIHLGFCENIDGSKAKDFNCRRHTHYTYNVKINGVSNVVVEAKKEEEEPQPGSEGWVIDDTGAYVGLDSHYCEFNISLSDKERYEMVYRITAPYDGTTYVYTHKADGTHTMTDGMNEQLYSWIKFYPTSDKNTLATYNGGKGENTLGKGDGLWTLDDLVSEDKVSPYPDDEKGEKWYTVFIDEYVYTFDDGADGVEVSWPKYVNQGNRIAQLFLLDEGLSKDTESIYTYCKYTFGQKAIQTYYKGVAVDGVNTAIGVEHDEETYCLNMNWNFLTGGYSNERNGGGYNFSNGRYNLYHYLTTKTDMKWGSVVNQTQPGHVNAGSSDTYGTSHEAADYPVFMPKAYGTSLPQNPPTPGQGENGYYANSICMNRNRDLNGNDTIDADEIRWYLPTSAVYMQIAIAQGEMPSPIVRFTEYSSRYFVNIQEGASNRGLSTQDLERYGTYNFHYITSDYQYFWAEQSITTGDNPYSGWYSYLSAAYTARCVRNLGTKPSTLPQQEGTEVGHVYIHDKDAHTFTLLNYKDETLRGYNEGGIAPHDIASPSARLYKKFEYANDIVRNISDDYASFNGNGDWSYNSIENWTKSLMHNTICGKYYQEADKSDRGTWRVPNDSELALMWIENIPQKYGNSSLTSTHDYFVAYSLKDNNPYNWKYIGYHNGGDRMVMALDILGQTVRVRCVRDVR